ncbi:LOW QUALITY PROTEIN: hypothetical protein ElyMa_002306100 [Elysia marginata]|uniref:Uncharacterized protein n=1 Tax=Elysia marginata TaxID=1093978 RepID=A0AAV4G454_9GAST|nr:LOW QUALITY PROTEIN: hypothetical protein ElyMa_002306100 [Elysia marginata]
MLCRYRSLVVVVVVAAAAVASVVVVAVVEVVVVIVIVIIGEAVVVVVSSRSGSSSGSSSSRSSSTTSSSYSSRSSRSSCSSRVVVVVVVVFFASQLSWKHRPPTKVLHTVLSWAISSSSLHVFCAEAISASVSLLHVLLGLPLALRSCGFHTKLCLVMHCLGFLKVCPTHLHFLLLNYISIGCCCVSFPKDGITDDFRPVYADDFRPAYADDSSHTYICC